MEEIKNSTDLEEKSAFLTYLLAQKSLIPEEANSHAVDLMMGAVETVSTTPFDKSYQHESTKFLSSTAYDLRKCYKLHNIPLDNQNQTL